MHISTYLHYLQFVHMYMYVVIYLDICMHLCVIVCVMQREPKDGFFFSMGSCTQHLQGLRDWSFHDFGILEFFWNTLLVDMATSLSLGQYMFRILFMLCIHKSTNLYIYKSIHHNSSLLWWIHCFLANVNSNRPSPRMASQTGVPCQSCKLSGSRRLKLFAIWCPPGVIAS